ncbi:MAG: hypothetical protein R2712_01105 [Vicinamibacterales bacterium]
MGFDAVPDALPHRHGFSGAGVEQDDRELVATPNGNDVGLAHRPPDDGRCLDEGAAAGQVAVGVVDGLEPVQVQEEQRERPARARCALGFPSQDVIQIP